MTTTDPINWQGYPIADRQGDRRAEYHGHIIEIELIVERWSGLRTYDLAIDGETKGQGYPDLRSARMAALEIVAHIGG